MCSLIYHYVATDIKVVMAHITDFIIPENRAAIEYLWNMNILTRQTNNYENNCSFICLGDLSKENKAIFSLFANSNQTALPDGKIGYIYGGKGIEIPFVPQEGHNTFLAFKPFLDQFVMQDVQKDGYMTVEEFFIKYTDCKKIVSNPQYKIPVKPMRKDYESQAEYIIAYNKYLDDISVPPRIMVVDESRITKTLDEYLIEYGFGDCYDPDEGKIYYNRRLFEGHKRYKEWRLSLHR